MPLSDDALRRAIKVFDDIEGFTETQRREAGTPLVTVALITAIVAALEHDGRLLEKI